VQRVRCTISGTVSTAVQRGLALRPVALFLVLFLWRLYGACERLKMEKNERHKSLAMAQVAELDPSLPLCLRLLMLQAQPLQLKSLRPTRVFYTIGRSERHIMIVIAGLF
jgi:hypothetical protein